MTGRQPVPWSGHHDRRLFHTPMVSRRRLFVARETCFEGRLSPFSDFSTGAHMFQYLNWASDLEGISPVARLLAIRFANYASYAGDGPCACETDLEKALAWIGCELGELLVAMGELREQGVDPLLIEGARICYTLPQLEWTEPKQNPRPARKNDLLWIYVITANDHVSEIGISKFPDYRLANLQAANPIQPLSIAWKAQGPSVAIRRAERAAHQALAAYALGNEWFGVHYKIATDTVRRLLAGDGIEA